MTAASWIRLRSVAATASVLLVIAVAAGAVFLALGAGGPDTWWPHIGQVFASDTHTMHQDPCAWIIGQAKAYCERGTAAPRQHGSGGVWRLAAAGAGVAALVVWRLRSTAGQRRP